MHKFCKTLSDDSTIRSCISSIDGDPDFTIESFDASALKAKDAKKCNKEVLFSFMLDEITIRKFLQHSPSG